MFKIVDTRTGKTVREIPAHLPQTASNALKFMRDRLARADRASLQLREVAA